MWSFLFVLNVTVQLQNCHTAISVSISLSLLAASDFKLSALQSEFRYCVDRPIDVLNELSHCFSETFVVAYPTLRYHKQKDHFVKTLSIKYLLFSDGLFPPCCQLVTACTSHICSVRPARRLPWDENTSFQFNSITYAELFKVV
jgi:hypothetical protein